MNTWPQHLAQFNLAGKVAVAVSGGADSMALVKLMHVTYPDTVAVTVDHQLRQESRAEAEQVAKWMAQWGVPHVILTWQMPSTQRIQERARQARYALIGKWCQEMGIHTLMTAHHLDDMIETFWMRAFKGSGPAGLCGMAVERTMSFGRLIRPALSLPGDQLKGALGDHPFIEDPSNDNTRFERVRCRVWLKENPEQRAAALRSMMQFQQSELFAQQHVQHALETYVSKMACDVLPGWQSLDAFISQRMWQALVRKMAGDVYPMSHDLCMRVDRALRNGKAITASGVWLKPVRGGVTLQLENRS